MSVRLTKIQSPRIIQLAGWPESFAGVIARIGERTGWEIPERPGHAGGAGGITVFRVGAERLWIASFRSPHDTFDFHKGDVDFEIGMGTAVISLEDICAESAAVWLEISAGIAVFQVSGASAEATLQKGTPIDLHPGAFPAGAAARSARRGIGFLVHRRDDEIFEVYVNRSYAAAFRRRLCASALEFGYAVGNDDNDNEDAA